MFKAISMYFISLNLLKEDVPLIAKLLAEMGMFNPEDCGQFAQWMPDKIGTEFQTNFYKARIRLEKILTRTQLTFPDLPSGNNKQPVSLEQILKVHDQLGTLIQQLTEFDEQLHQLQTQQVHLQQLLEMLKKFIHLDLDLALFQGQKQFLNLHVGTVPRKNFQHLQEAIALAKHVINIFHQDEQTFYIVVAGSLLQANQVGSVLNHADFQPLNIPPEFHHHPQQVHTELTEKLFDLQTRIETVQNQIQVWLSTHQAELQQAHALLSHSISYAQLAEMARGKGELVLIEGWVPQSQLPVLEQSLAENLKHPWVLTARSPHRHEYKKVPTLIKHNLWLAAFSQLIKQYGIPRYGEFDPTLWFTLTFIAMFGSMFGDVGHGAVIAGLGFYFQDKLRGYAPILMLAGASSMIFGALYGSVFGFEEYLFPALWMSPIHDPEHMLTVALYWGMGFILIAVLITIFNRWQDGHYVEALLNSTGLAGIALYLGGFYAIRDWMNTGEFESQQLWLVLIPWSLILSYKWYLHKTTFGERFLVTIVEGFEAITNYLANTLSFLRVAAFSLNHVALAIAIFTLAKGLEGTAHGLVILLGNVFIIVLEGAIVTIQVLRLEYYEGFSRFFSGDGRLFMPLKNKL